MNAETSLVFCTIAFVAVLYGYILVKGPRLGLGKKTVFDKTKMPLYIKFMAIVAVASLLLGFVTLKRMIASLEYVTLNLFIAAIFGANIFLYRYKDKD